jgi:hypothetical protein
MIPNTFAIADANAAAGDGSLNYAEGVSKTLLAHNMMLLVDFIGDVPFSQANNPDEFPAPVVDSGADVYATALSLLDEAVTLFDGATGEDLFYNTGGIGNTDQWIRLVNTIRMKAALTTGDLATFTAIESAGNFINDPADDFQYQYIENDVNPDGRHPDYINDYTPSGSNIYPSNWLMNQMMTNNDPRIRYYFYRQSGCVPGASCNPDPMGEAVTQLTCSILQPPVHYVNAGFGDIFCFLEDGYWGRPHGNDEGTPPDGFLKTASGVYPSGGSFDGASDYPEDDSDFAGKFVAVGAGGGGAGIEPIMLASFVDFYKAEAYLASNDAVNAAVYLEAGISKSIAKVQSFGALDGAADAAAMTSAMNPDRIASFIDATIADFNAAPLTSALDGFGWPVEKDKMDILGEQLMVAQFGAGNDAFNFIRRTGHPRTLARSLEGSPGLFPRSVLYPSSEVSANPSIDQKTDLSVKVFWDEGVTNPAN